MHHVQAVYCPRRSCLFVESSPARGSIWQASRCVAACVSEAVSPLNAMYFNSTSVTLFLELSCKRLRLRKHHLTQMVENAQNVFRLLWLK